MALGLANDDDDSIDNSNFEDDHTIDEVVSKRIRDKEHTELRRRLERRLEKRRLKEELGIYDIDEFFEVD
jgi:hypothetical protein